MAEANFKLVCEAYEVLSDRQKRQTYDTLGKGGLKGIGGGQGGFSQQQAEEIFRQFFGDQNPFEVIEQMVREQMVVGLPPGATFSFVGGMHGGIGSGTGGGGMSGMPPGVAQMMEEMMEGRAAPKLLAGPSLAELDEVTDAQAAHQLSEQCSRSILASSVRSLSPMAMMVVMEQVHALEQHNDTSGVTAIGHHRSKLLPSGIVLHCKRAAAPIETFWRRLHTRLPYPTLSCLAFRDVIGGDDDLTFLRHPCPPRTPCAQTRNLDWTAHLPLFYFTT